jgi:hypothetical protein
LSVRPLDVHLHEGAGQLFLLPRRARFAGAQADRDILHPHRLPRLQRQVADDAVALVEQAEDRDPLRHRRDAGEIARRSGNVDGYGLIALNFIALPRPVAARDRREQGQD